MSLISSSSSLSPKLDSFELSKKKKINKKKYKIMILYNTPRKYGNEILIKIIYFKKCYIILKIDHEII